MASELRASTARAMSMATRFTVDSKDVLSLLDPIASALPGHQPTELHPAYSDRNGDAQFRAAFLHGLAAIPKAERSGSLAGRTGHIGESLAAVLLDRLDFHIIDQFSGPFSGGHGADLIVMSPSGQVAVVEVKATLVSSRWPRPSRGEIQQLSAEWIDKPDNPAVVELEVNSGDLYGIFLVVNFADRKWSSVVTPDFGSVLPVIDTSDLVDLQALCGN